MNRGGENGALEQFNARSYWLVIAAAWGLFLVLGVLAMDPFISFVIAEVEWLSSIWPVAGARAPLIPVWGWTALISMEIILLGSVVIVLHEASHFLAHRLLGTSSKRIRFRLNRMNPRILVEGFEPFRVKVLSAAAPMITTLLPAAIGLTLAQGGAWAGFFALAAAMALGISIGDVNVLANYLSIPRGAMVRVSADGEITEWYIPDQGSGD